MFSTQNRRSNKVFPRISKMSSGQLAGVCRNLPKKIAEGETDDSRHNSRSFYPLLSTFALSALLGRFSYFTALLRRFSSLLGVFSFFDAIFLERCVPPLFPAPTEEKRGAGEEGGEKEEGGGENLPLRSSLMWRRGRSRSTAAAAAAAAAARWRGRRRGRRTNVGLFPPSPHTTKERRKDGRGGGGGGEG